MLDGFKAVLKLWLIFGFIGVWFWLATLNPPLVIGLTIVFIPSFAVFVNNMDD